MVYLWYFNIYRFPSQANVEQRAVEFLNAFYKEAYNARKMVIESRLPIGAIPAFSGSGEGDSENQYKRPEVTSEDMKGKTMVFAPNFEL